MELNLHRPICFFDLETTGVNVTKDRIVEISILKVFPDAHRESKTWLVNPQRSIPPETTAIHGVSNEDVKDAPTFRELAPEVLAMIRDADLAGYNSNKFDIPVLAEELMRAEVDYDLRQSRAVDVQNIFHKKEQRTLEAAYRFYCAKELKNAHSAEADTMATYEVLKGQLDKYDDLENDVRYLAEYSNRFQAADFAGFIIINKEGKECFSFGKYRQQPVEEILDRDPGYYGWIQKADFPLYTKKVLTAIKLRKLQQ